MIVRSPQRLANKSRWRTNKFLELARADTWLMDDAVEPRCIPYARRAQSLIGSYRQAPHRRCDTRQYVDDQDCSTGIQCLKIGDFEKRFPTRNYVSWFCLELSRFVGACEEASRTACRCLTARLLAGGCSLGNLDSRPYVYWKRIGYLQALERILKGGRACSIKRLRSLSLLERCKCIFPMNMLPRMREAGWRKGFLRRVQHQNQSLL